MAIVHPMTDVSRATLTTRTMATAIFPPAISHGFEMDLDTPLVKTVSERITEPLAELDARLEAVSDSLLSDNAEESSEFDALDDLPERGRRSSASSTRQATGTEDAFQS